MRPDLLDMTVICKEVRRNRQQRCGNKRTPICDNFAILGDHAGVTDDETSPQSSRA